MGFLHYGDGVSKTTALGPVEISYTAIINDASSQGGGEGHRQMHSGNWGGSMKEQ